jgi:hypothetical protein
VRNLHLFVLVAVLAAIGLGVCGYKVRYLGLPLQPTDNAEVWSVQARLAFEGTNKPSKVQLLLPPETRGMVRLEEDFISGKFGLAIEKENGQRVAQWAVRRAKGPQVLYYRIGVATQIEVAAEAVESKPTFPKVPKYEEPYASAIDAILSDVRNESADVATFTRELLQQLNDPNPNENVKLIRGEAFGKREWAPRIVEILAGAQIPARLVYGLPLTAPGNNLSLVTKLQVHNDRQWLSFDPVTAEAGLPENFLIWRVGVDPLVSSEGVNLPELSFSLTRSYREVIDVAKERAEKIGSSMMRWSLTSLPVQTQNVYRILLTIPIGALLIVILRNVIGIRTFGTFMPILMALAFRETQLLWGVVLFSLMVGLGLLIRFYLERLLLLLVPRLASVVIIVVILMAVVSVISNDMGAERALSIALFPMVILAMTIERMSLVWEEHGPSEALTQGFGSLFVASLGYLLMANELLSHLVFVFPELLLVLLSITLLLGRYSGYRLTELIRFADAGNSQSEINNIIEAHDMQGDQEQKDKQA